MNLPLPILYSVDPAVTWKQLNDPSFDISTVDQSQGEKFQAYCEKEGIKRCMLDDSDYHFKFHGIPSKPKIFYYMGDLSILNNKVLGIVGPRFATDYGKKVIKQLLHEAKSYQITTISGLAEGIDTLCYKESINNDIPTIAVLGGGIQHFLQYKRQDLDRIVSNGGLIISEFKIGFKPTNYSFPQRNRIIAGLSDIVFVPEASEKSGSLITVDFAIQAHKEVFATPNDIYNIHSTGINKYISEHKIQAIYHISHFLQSHFASNNNATLFDNNIQVIENITDPKQQLIIKNLKFGSLNVEQLIEKTGFTIMELISYLSILEIQGIINQPNVGVYSIM